MSPDGGERVGDPCRLPAKLLVRSPASRGLLHGCGAVVEKTVVIGAIGKHHHHVAVALVVGQSSLVRVGHGAAP